MKTRQLILRAIGSRALALAGAILIILTGCQNPSWSISEPESTAGDKGHINLSVSKAVSRTIMPTEIKPKLFKVDFIPASDSGLEPVSKTFEGDSVDVELFPGAYSLNIFGYLDSEQPHIAEASQRVEVYSGKTSIVTVDLALESISENFSGTGAFEWDISTTMPQEEIKSVNITISKNNTTVKDISPSAPSRDTVWLDTGYYTVSALVENIYGAKSVYFETLWIYPGLHSKWDITISGENFFAEYGSSAINWNLDPNNPPVLLTEVREVYQGDVISLEVKSTHKTYSFFVDGVQVQNSESTAYQLSTEELLPGSHKITIVGANEKGIPWSSSVWIKVIKKEIASLSNLAVAISGLVINESVVDGDGNVYLSAYQTDSSNKAVLIKLAPDGSEIWRKPSVGSGTSYLSGIAIDGNHIYVSGSFTGTLGFGGSSVTGTSSVENPVVACFDAAGNSLWIKTSLSGTSYGGFGSIAVDETGIYCAGMFYHTRDMGNGVVVSSNSWANFDSPWIVKYDFNGNTLWGITSTQNRCASISDLAVANGTLYATGYTNGSGNSPFQWGNLPALNASGYNYNGWAGAFNTNDGSAKWAVLAPVGGSSSFDGISVKDDYVYASGFADPSITLGNSDTTMKGLLVKYNAADGAVVWSKDSGVSGSRYSRVYADDSGIYAVGYDKTTGKNRSILKSYDVNGNVQNTATVSGSSNAQYVNITSDAQALYIVGTQIGSGEYSYDTIETPVRGTSSGNNGVLIRYVK